MKYALGGILFEHSVKGATFVALFNPKWMSYEPSCVGVF
jgi:hypothetical protein